MRECETGTGKSSFVKRVTVRSGGAGHAHSGVVKVSSVVPGKGNRPSKWEKSRIVSLGR
jgi:hypothetical protein